MLWLLPLLGAMAGNRIHESKFANLSTGVVLVRPGATAFAPGASIPSTDGGIHPALSSPELLQSVIAKLDLRSRWQLSAADSYARLRGMIRLQSVEGTILTEVTVRGSSMVESLEVCHSVLEEFTRIVNRQAFEERALSLASSTEAASRQESLVEQKREALSKLLRRDKYGSFPVQEAEFEQAQRDLEKLKIHEITLRLESEIWEERVLVHEWPSAASPVSMRSEWTRSLLLHLALGLAAGALSSIVSIYLAELSFPKRESPSIGSGL